MSNFLGVKSHKLNLKMVSNIGALVLPNVLKLPKIMQRTIDLEMILVHCLRLNHLGLVVFVQKKMSRLSSLR